MRIVGGEWRGRPLLAPKGHATRPTSDRVREALFDALCARLGSDLGGPVVLDLYAGTGALGLEALSRGAVRTVFVENDRGALDALARNVKALGAEARSTVVAGDATGAAIARAARLGPFALLLIDPPYRIEPAVVAKAVLALEGAGALTGDVVVAHEHARSARPAAVDGFEVVRTYTYGDTAVSLLLRADPTQET